MLPRLVFPGFEPGNEGQQQIGNTEYVVAHTAQLLGLEPGRFARIEHRGTITELGLITALGGIMGNTGQESAGRNATIEAAAIAADHDDPLEYFH